MGEDSYRERVCLMQSYGLHLMDHPGEIYLHSDYPIYYEYKESKWLLSFFDIDGEMTCNILIGDMLLETPVLAIIAKYELQKALARANAPHHVKDEISQPK